MKSHILIFGSVAALCLSSSLAMAAYPPENPQAGTPATVGTQNPLADQTVFGNGSFETGDFASWVVQDLEVPYNPLHVGGAGETVPEVPSFLPLFATEPTDGLYAAIHGFDGSPGTIEISQDVLIDRYGGTLTFDYRAAWDMRGFGATESREFRVQIEPSGGAAAAIIPLLAPAPDEVVDDTGPLSAELSLNQYAGQQIRISFVWDIPENFTGPAIAQLDNVRITAAPSPVPSMPLFGLLALGGLLGLFGLRKLKQ